MLEFEDNFLDNTLNHAAYFARFTKSRKCFACAFSEGMWMYIMCPAS